MYGEYVVLMTVCVCFEFENGGGGGDDDDDGGGEDDDDNDDDIDDGGSGKDDDDDDDGGGGGLQISELLAELSDERSTSESVSQLLENETTERLRLETDLSDLQVRTLTHTLT